MSGECEVIQASQESGLGGLESPHVQPHWVRCRGDVRKLSRWLADWREDHPLAEVTPRAPSLLLPPPEGCDADEAPPGRRDRLLIRAAVPAAGRHGGLPGNGPIRLAGVLYDITTAIDRKDPYTCGHSDRVAWFSSQLAKVLGWREEQLSVVYLAGLLHDIGKIGVEAEILRKPAKLTEAEYEQVKSHPRVGHEILVDVEALVQVLPAVLHHHERWDGSGYPGQLRGDEIPAIARIVAVADAYDAMTSERPYRHGLPRTEVQRIFQEGLGRHWDPQVVDAFLQAEPGWPCNACPACPGPPLAPEV